MSADSWAPCPKCKLKTDATNDKRYDSFQGKAFCVREDYEVGIVNGGFFLDYHASCQNCDFAFHKSLSETLEEKP